MLHQPRTEALGRARSQTQHMAGQVAHSTIKGHGPARHLLLMSSWNVAICEAEARCDVQIATRTPRPNTMTILAWRDEGPVEHESKLGHGQPTAAKAGLSTRSVHMRGGQPRAHANWCRLARLCQRQRGRRVAPVAKHYNRRLGATTHGHRSLS
jgi:hypothetical protein